MVIVEYCWQQPFRGTNIFRLWTRLKLCKEPPKILQHQGDSLDKRNVAVRERLHEIQTHINYASNMKGRE